MLVSITYFGRVALPERSNYSSALRASFLFLRWLRLPSAPLFVLVIATGARGRNKLAYSTFSKYFCDRGF